MSAKITTWNMECSVTLDSFAVAQLVSKVQTSYPRVRTQAGVGPAMLIVYDARKPSALQMKEHSCEINGLMAHVVRWKGHAMRTSSAADMAVKRRTLSFSRGMDNNNTAVLIRRIRGLIGPGSQDGDRIRIPKRRGWIEEPTWRSGDRMERGQCRVGL